VNVDGDGNGQTGSIDADCKILSAFSEGALDENGDLKDEDVRVLRGLEEQSAFTGSHNDFFIGVDAVAAEAMEIN
jgi:hypothetical protein